VAKHVSSLELALRERPSKVAITEWLYGELRAAILDGRLKRGIRLPATRDFARQYGVARGTATLVFEQLRDEGYLNSRTGAGTWVNENLPPNPLALRGADPLSVNAVKSARSRTAPRKLRAFWPSAPAVDAFPIDVWSRLASRKWRQATCEMLLDGDIAGFAPLRETIVEYLGTSRSVRCSAEQVVVVTGTQQALDLVARLAICPGDAAWIEDPGYFGASAALQNARARIIPVPVDSDGIDVQRGQQLAPHAKLAYVTPAHQFPLGASMTIERRIALLHWARSVNALIVEDDYDSEYRFNGKPIPSLQGLDRAGSVIFIGSFNKVLFPSLRLGYMVVPDQLVDRVLKLRFETDFWVNSVNQAVLAAFIAEAHFGRHIRRMREIYAGRLAALHEAATKYLGDSLRIPIIRAGLATAAFYNAPIASLELERRAADSGVDAIALGRFTRRKRDIRGILLGFAAFDSTEISRGMQKLATVLEKCNRKRP
jgi:GntR family transcriptional regulator / MocR family aminotransferase